MADILETVYPTPQPKGVERTNKYDVRVSQARIPLATAYLVERHHGLIVAHALRQLSRIGRLHLDVVHRSLAVAHIHVKAHGLRIGPRVKYLLASDMLYSGNRDVKDCFQDLPAQLRVHHGLAEHKVVRNGQVFPLAIECHERPSGIAHRSHIAVPFCIHARPWETTGNHGA